MLLTLEHNLQMAVKYCSSELQTWKKIYRKDNILTKSSSYSLWLKRILSVLVRSYFYVTPSNNVFPEVYFIHQLFARKIIENIYAFRFV